MNRDWLYLRYRSKWLAEKCARKLGVKFHEPAVYAGMPVIPIEQAQAFVKERILSGEPFAAGRFGSVELSAFWHQDAIEPVRPKTKRAVLNEMCCNAGFFPPDERKLEQFAQIMRLPAGGWTFSACGLIPWRTTPSMRTEIPR